MTVPQPSVSVGPTDVPLLDLTIGEVFERVVSESPGREALVDVPSGRRWTYGELAVEVERVALGLVGLGVVAGDRVGVWAPNCPEWVFVQFATARVGAVLVTVNPGYRSHEVGYVLRQSGVRTVVAARSFRSSDYAGMLAEVRPSCPELVDVLLIGSPEWEDLPAGDPEVLRSVAAELRADQAINIQYTSGTTGHPKGATLSHHNILNNARLTGLLCGYTEQERICVPVPFYHCFGMVAGNLAALTHGACVVIPAPAFDPAATLRAVEAERCTSLYGVPTMFIAELSEPGFAEYDLGSLRTGIMGGSPCPVEVMKEVVERMGMRDVSICYGMTETSPVSTQTRLDDSLERRVSTVGRAGPHLTVKVVDPRTGETVPCGTPGELLVQGYAVMLGYWADPERTAEAVDAEGWMRTGDLAVMDEQGYLTITGRIKDMVIRGGENLYPREIEEFLYTHPDILDAQVIGVPDQRYGEELMAWVRLRPGAVELTHDGLHAFCAGRIDRHKIPRYLHLVDEYPMTVTGKVRKVEMRERAIDLLGLHRVAEAGRA
ncbi:AMP-binding protein [Kitasatospora sp. NPDC096147]|uniref:AMP-binding protein n=1 Tax=Kitasatospora sp. NPDC096147 TaxID=3364093 RepID=UPI00380AFD25